MLSCALLLPGAALADPAALLQLIDYVAVDYPAAVVDGAVVSDAEYAEMREFAGRAVELADALPLSPERAAIATAARELVAQVERRAPVEELRATASRARQLLLASYPLESAPRRVPDLASGARLFAAHCASCHGAAADGRGPNAAQLEPRPTDFTDADRARQRSLYGLYSTITRGVDGTAMRAFAELPADARWSLAWFVGSQHLGPAVGLPLAAPLPDLARFATHTPLELERDGFPPPALAALRSDPRPLFTTATSPLGVARAELAAALAAHGAGDREGAYRHALAGYLDGFELAEASLRALDPGAVVEVEREMLALRELLRSGDGNAIAARIAALDGRLAALDERSSDPDALAPGVAFGSSLFILLREGLEALLLVGLIVTVLVKTGHREGLRAVHAGWSLALALGFATWAVSSWLIVISGATRELTEGVAALLASAVLLYVGFWMHDKLSAARWQRFMQEQIEAALDGGSRWTLALLSFIAVYREVFETVLFYQALWVQAGTADARQAIALGGLTAGLVLAAIGWTIFALGMRLPLRFFFAASAVLMVVLALAFAGKGVAALQEAGRLPHDALALPAVELLGIYPSLQGLGLQLALLGLAVGMVLYNRRRSTLAATDQATPD